MVNRTGAYPGLLFSVILLTAQGPAKTVTSLFTLLSVLVLVILFFVLGCSPVNLITIMVLPICKLF